MRYILPFPSSPSLLCCPSQSLAADIDWAKVDAALGKNRIGAGVRSTCSAFRAHTSPRPEGPRAFEPASLNGWALVPRLVGRRLPRSTPPLARNVLTEPEIEPVMTKLLASGIEVTALHNHLLRANPATYYMHVHGHGNCRPRRAWREQDAIWSSCRACVSTCTD